MLLSDFLSILHAEFNRKNSDQLGNESRHNQTIPFILGSASEPPHLFLLGIVIPVLCYQKALRCVGGVGESSGQMGNGFFDINTHVTV